MAKFHRLMPTQKSNDQREDVDSQTQAQRVLENANAISSERLKSLFAYWTKLRGARFAPPRNELKPAQMREQLGWLWLMDVLDGGQDFRFRMGGDRVIQFFGQRLAGTTLRALQPASPAFFGRFFDLVSLATRNKKAALGGPTQTAYEPRAFLEVEALILPLSDDGKTVTGLLGSIEIRPLKKIPDPRD
jgi:hypothetical protein